MAKVIEAGPDDPIFRGGWTISSPGSLREKIKSMQTSQAATADPSTTTPEPAPTLSDRNSFGTNGTHSNQRRKATKRTNA